MKPDIRNQPVSDNDIMPFGSHKERRTPMQWVPLTYFRWFLDQPWSDEWPHVKAYAQNRVKPAAVASVRHPDRVAEPSPKRRDQ